MTRIIRRERIASTDPRLKRHVHHDSESRRYEYPTEGLSIVSAKHVRRIPVLDQGNLGSCTGQAGIGCLGTDPFYSTLTGATAAANLNPWPPKGGWKYTLSEEGAVALYSAATQLDDYPGAYPPEDTGSDGLSIAKALKAAGEISGYQHTFSLDACLKALGVQPVIVGTVWTEGMFTSDADGRLHPSGAVAGGHEYVLDEIDADRQEVWLTNSWGTSWGIGGRAYLTFDDVGQLLDQQGDVTVFVPLTSPAPVPTPPAGRWRVGRSLHRTIYRDGHFEGFIDSPEMARHIVDVLNAAGA